MKDNSKTKQTLSVDDVVVVAEEVNFADFFSLQTWFSYILLYLYFLLETELLLSSIKSLGRYT